MISRDRRVRVIAWCEDLGFRSVASGEHRAALLRLTFPRVLVKKLATLSRDYFHRTPTLPFDGTFDGFFSQVDGARARARRVVRARDGSFFFFFFL